jgi:antitoxin VapB
MTRLDEFSIKLRRVREFLSSHKLAGVLLHTQPFFNWATAGAESYVTLAGETGVGYFFITADSATVLANNIEIHRFCIEEFAELDRPQNNLEFWSAPWHEEYRLLDEVRRRMGKRQWASDCSALGSIPLPKEFETLTYTLESSEIERYRKLGKDCSIAMEDALDSVVPGLKESDIAGLICQSMFKYNVRPQLALVAADERVFNFRHPIPTSRKLRKHLMAVLCGKRGGQIISLTRMVYFGKNIPPELRRKHTAVCAIDVALNAGTRAGRRICDVFDDGLKEYASQGFAEEWQLHHQGGPTGYQGRSFRGTSSETRTVLPSQAFAWNPSITGTKSEDTILISNSKNSKEPFEFLSAPTHRWPARIGSPLPANSGGGRSSRDTLAGKHRQIDRYAISQSDNLIIS